MSALVEKSGLSNVEGEIQSHKVAPVEYPPSYNDATSTTHHPTNMMNNQGMPGPPGSYYPNLPPPGSDIQMQPMMPGGGGAPYPQAYPSAPPNYGPNQQQPPYPSPYPPPMTTSQPPVGFVPPPHQQQPMMPPPNQGGPAGGEYNYPQTYVVVPPGDQNQRRDSDGMDCCKCLLCCCGCIELCRCFGMCLKCICDSDD